MLHHKTESEKRNKVRELINDIGYAILVTHGPSGGLHGRPMQTAKLEEGWDTIWFATQRNSGKVAEVKDDDHVFLGYGKDGEWVSVSGRARLVTDRAKIHELWSPLWKNWFEGPDDPNVMLIEVTPEVAEYWDNGSQIFAFAAMAAAAVTGKKFEVGENEKVEFAGHAGT